MPNIEIFIDNIVKAMILEDKRKKVFFSTIYPKYAFSQIKPF